MEYTVPFHSEISGDAIPLRYIAEAMARKAASTFGTRKLHGPTLINTRTRYESSLLDAVRKGNLKVCGSDGIVGTVGELVNAAEGIPEKCSDDVKAMLALYVKRQHLNEWAMTNGDVFCLMDVPADVLEFGPERPDGTKEYRGYVGWPFDYFGEHGYLDVELGGIPIELADDDFETDGFVKVASAVTAIAKFLLSKGAPNKFQAERDAWPHILTGVAKGAIHPINPDTLQVLSVEYCGNGMVPFSELVTWGRTTKLFAFRRAADAVGNDDDAAEGGGGAQESDGITQAKQAPSDENPENFSQYADWFIPLNTKGLAAMFKIKIDSEDRETKKRGTENLKWWKARIDEAYRLPLLIAARDGSKNGYYNPAKVADYLHNTGNLNADQCRRVLRKNVLEKHLDDAIAVWGETLT